jgi:hypothetical protein
MKANFLLEAADLWPQLPTIFSHFVWFFGVPVSNEIIREPSETESIYCRALNMIFYFDTSK